jgi:hypothetical protein
MMRLAKSEPDAVDFLKGLEEFGFGQRPYLCGRRRGTGRDQEAVNGSTGGFVCTFHGREISLGPDVVRSEEQVGNFYLGFRPVLEGPALALRKLPQPHTGFRGPSTPDTLVNAARVFG